MMHSRGRQRERVCSISPEKDSSHHPGNRMRISWLPGKAGASNDRGSAHMICRVCGNRSANRSYRFHEMMFGTGDVFDYFKCGRCGCLQIQKEPEDPAKYYPTCYYAFQSPGRLFDNPIKAFFKHQRSKARLGPINPIRSLLAAVYRPPDYFHWFERAGVTLTSNILDVGCGNGSLLVRLRKDGFVHLTGADPHIARSVVYANGVRLLKKKMDEMEGSFDFIMLHHCFEHMPDPLSVLMHLHRLLPPRRYTLIRIPVAGTWAWRHYGGNWVQLDAPRHMYLHTEASVKILAEKTGFQLSEVVYDSTEFQFWGSEQCLRGIPLRGSHSLAQNRHVSTFTGDELRAFKRRARELNENRDGDQACFFFYRP